MLVRPNTKENEFSRLHHLLFMVFFTIFILKIQVNQAAKRGVEIKIIVWCESSLLTLDSNHTKTKLESLHENIQVLRHPGNQYITVDF
jgi:hypothetical protein